MLYYYDDESLWRYDTATRTKTPLGRIPLGDISPDEKSTVFIDRINDGNHGVAIHNIQTGQDKLIYQSANSIFEVYWLPEEMILVKESKHGELMTVFMDISGRVRGRLKAVSPDIVSLDSSSFIHYGNNGRYYRYDVQKRAEKESTAPGMGNFLYLSKRMVVYRDLAYTNRVRVFNTKTRAIKDLDWLEMGDITRLSPSLRCYWTAHYSIGEWSSEPSDLRLIYIPAKSVQVLKEMQAR
jgi:hypothetical protein